MLSKLSAGDVEIQNTTKRCPKSKKKDPLSVDIHKNEMICSHGKLSIHKLKLIYTKQQNDMSKSTLDLNSDEDKKDFTEREKTGESQKAKLGSKCSGGAHCTS